MQLSKTLLLGGICLFGNVFAGTTWPAGQQISDSPSLINPFPFSVAMDQNSNAITGWLEGELGVDNTIYSASLPADTETWYSPIVITTGTPPQYVSFPVFFAEDTGLIKGAWVNFQQNEGVFNQLYMESASKESVLDGAWSEPISSSVLNGFPYGGGGSIDTLGNQLRVLALVSDYVTPTPPYSIQLVTLGGEATEWAGPDILGEDNSSISGPVVFGGVSQGMGLISWRQGLSLKTSRYDFSNETLIDLADLTLPSGTTDIGFITGSVSLSGDAVIAIGLRNGEGPNYAIYTSSLPATSSNWTYPEIVSNPSNNTMANFLSLKTDNTGNAVILWGESTSEGNVFVRAASLPFGGTLSDVVDLTPSNPSTSTSIDDKSAISLAVDQFGNAVGVWQFHIGDDPTVQVASCSVGGDWSSPQVLSSTGSFPRTALSNQGTAQAVWLDSISSLVYGSTNKDLFPLSAPSGFAGYFSNASENNYYLNVHWTPSQAPNVVNYQIFRDDNLVASVAGTSPFTYQFLFDCEQLDGVYTLVAVGSNGNKSEPITFTLTE